MPLRSYLFFAMFFVYDVLFKGIREDEWNLMLLRDTFFWFHDILFIDVKKRGVVLCFDDTIFPPISQNSGAALRAAAKDSSPSLPS